MGAVLEFLLFLVLGLASVWLILLRFRPSASLRLPPGPSGWPILGTFLDMRKIFDSAYINALASKYGPVFTLQMGCVPMIFITESSIAHEAFVEKGAVFASRPLVPKTSIINNNRRNINASPYGPRWRALRRNLVCGVLSSSRISSYAGVRDHAIQALVNRLRDESAKEGAVSVLKHCRFAVFELLSYVCFGRHLEEAKVNYMDELLKEIFISPRFFLGDFLPLLRFLPDKKLKNNCHLTSRQNEFFIPLIEETKKLTEQGRVDPNCYLNTLLAMRAEWKEEELSDRDLVVLCSELLNAGVDTTANCIEWCMANVVKNPGIQEKLIEEINRNVGQRAVKEEDIDKLPYLQALVKETLRRHPPGDGTLFHSVTQACKLAGYDIPTNAFIMLHTFSIANDPKVWIEPEKFRPERFLETDVDITGARDIRLIPFGIGRRICPGWGIALLHVHFILARLVQTFEWTTSKPGEAVDMSKKLAFATAMKNPLKVGINERLPSSL